jgi:hypothetical protein
VQTTVDIELAHARWRHFMWMVVGAVAGSLLIWKLGTVARWVGGLLIFVGLLNLRGFAMTLLHGAGRIIVGEDEVVLPRGLCRGAPATFPIAAVRHAYFLRRAVPWTRTGPLLIIETDQRVFAYPRDWFATDADQQQVAAVLNHRLGRL